jgi:hypothetical protein
MKPEIVRLHEIRVLIKIHEAGMGWEFEDLVVVEYDTPRMAQMKSSHDHFGDHKANAYTKHNQD